MERSRLRHLIPNEIRDILSQQPLWEKVYLAFLILNFLSSTQAFTTELHQLLVYRNLAPGQFGFLLWFVASLYLLQRAARSLLAADLQVNPNPRRSCLALIVFLSPTYTKQPMESLEDSSADQIVTAYYKDPWQQVLRALKWHLTEVSPNRLRTVVVVPSSDRSGAAQDPQQLGTARQFADFQRTASCLARSLNKSLEIERGSGEGGVDFEDARQLAECLNGIFASLSEKGMRDRDVLVDITGGSKLCSAVGAAIALQENRRFQYVSTHTGAVRVYELEYLAPKSG